MTRPLPIPPPLSELVANGPLALFVDFDGTLVEIAPTPDTIVVPPNLARRLKELAARMSDRLALVSGRGIADLENHLGSFFVACAGSHGADLRSATRATMGAGAAVLPAEASADVERYAKNNALLYEAKPHGAALHWRNNPKGASAAERFIGELATAHGLGIKHGKGVVELVGPGSEKGAAVRAFLANPPFAGSRPVFIGDDVTDEDGFAAAKEAGGFGIAVGEREAMGADYALADVAAVHHWLWP